MLKELYQLEEKVGSGKENDCYLKYNIDRKPSIIKIPNWFGKLWQTQGKAFLEKCLNALRKHEINTIQTDIRENIRAAFPNGKEKNHPTIIESPFIEDIDEYKIIYSDVIDEQLGPIIREKLAELIHKADELYRNDELGLDLLGGDAAQDLMKAWYQNIKLKIAKYLPQFVREKIENRTDGIRGEIRNLIMKDKEIILIDPGMHDLSKTGKLKFITRAIHHISIATLIKLIEITDPKYDTSTLPYNGSKLEKKLAEESLAICIPLFERYIKRGEELTPPLPFQTQTSKVPKSPAKSADL